MSGCYIVTGLLLCLTGIGAIVGIPMFLMGISMMFFNNMSVSFKKAGKWFEENTVYKGLCPYCSYEAQCPQSSPGMDCPSCAQRIIIRNRAFLTIEQAKQFEEKVVETIPVPIFMSPPELSEEEKAGKKKRQLKVLLILLGCMDFLTLCHVLNHSPWLGMLALILTSASPYCIWWIRKQPLKQKYPWDMVLFGLLLFLILIIAFGHQ